MDNIYVRMSGPSGNQLFRYATARYIQETQGEILFLIFLQFIKKTKISQSKLVLKIR